MRMVCQFDWPVTERPKLTRVACHSASSQPQFNEAAIQQLEAMGFPTIRCQKALLATGNSDAEAAMNWLFAHMEDAGTPRPGSYYADDVSDLSIDST